MAVFSSMEGFKMKRLFAILLICVFCLAGCGKVQVNNTAPAEELLTKRYPAEIVEEIRTRRNLGGINMDELGKLVKLECVRETNTDRYAVLQLDSGERAFVFAPGGEKVFWAIVFDGFPTRAEFEAGLSKCTTFNEVLEYDKSSYGAPVSCVLMTAHYVKEGMFVVTYDNAVEENPVTDVDFYENDETDTIYELFPYILEIDKA